jgi:hypothetical protein
MKAITDISTQGLKKWLSDYEDYLSFFCQFALHAYKYGGFKLHHIHIPSFEEWKTQFRDSNFTNATDYYLTPDNRLFREYHNCIHYETPVHREGYIPLYRIYHKRYMSVVYDTQVIYFNNHKPIKSAHGNP